MIALTQAMVVLLLAIYRFRWALCGFVFFLAFSPRTLGVVLTGETSLTFARIIFPLIVLMLLFFKAFAANRNNNSRPNIWNDPTFLSLVLLATIKVASTLHNEASLLYAFDDVIFSVGVFFIFYLKSDSKMVHAVIKALVFSLIITFFVLSIEYPQEKPIHWSVASTAFFQDDVLQIRAREGFYRAQAFFDNPLSLAEFLVYMTPISVYLALCAPFNRRTQYIVALLILLPVAIVSTGSRGGALAFLITLFVYFIAYNWKLISASKRIALKILLTAAVGIIVTYSINATLILGEKAQQINFFMEDDTARSTYSRALQYYETYQLLAESPLVGVGVHQNIEKTFDGIHKLDSYYLRTVLEGGTIGLIVFIVFLGLVFRKLYHMVNKSAPGIDASYAAMAISLWTGFVLMKFILSMPANNIYFYAMMGLIIGNNARIERVKNNAHPARS